jgi:hypothetical protein
VCWDVYAGVAMSLTIAAPVYELSTKHKYKNYANLPALVKNGQIINPQDIFLSDELDLIYSCLLESSGK